MSDHFFVLAALIADAQLVEITVSISECRDPKDNKFLDLAISGKATCIITGDADLTILHPFREIPILTQRQFLEHDWEKSE